MTTHRIVTSLCAFSAFAIALASFGTSYDPVIQLDDGQCYGDTVHFRVVNSKPSRYYEYISETNFLSKLTRRNFFLYRWSPSANNFRGYFSIDGNVTLFNGDESETTKAIEAAGLSVFSSTAVPSDSKILKLFPSDEVNSGYVLGVVDKACTRVYDMTSRISGYTKKGAKTSWDGVYYETTSGDVTGASSVKLTNLGVQAFYEDLIAGQTYMEAKEEEVKVTTPTLPDTTSEEVVETTAFTNDVVITTYYTNITIIVDPYFQNLNSILKFKYPKYATEGDWIVYSLERLGVQYDPLTVNLITNGHWCATVTWAAKEGGTKKVRIMVPISEDFNDNAPLEVLVKTLNRRVDTLL